MSFFVHTCLEWWQCCALLLRRSRFSSLGFPTVKAAGDLLRTSQNIGWIDAPHPLLRSEGASVGTDIGYGED